jgi:hypothetical protein
MSEELFDEAWPALTPRDEMFARVTTRGARLKATRRAVSTLLMVGGLLGAGAVGVGALGSVGGGRAEHGGPSEIAGPPLSDPSTTSGSDPSTTGPPGSTEPGSTAPGSTAPTTGSSTPGSSAPGTTPGSTAGTTPRSTTSTPPSTRPSTTTAPPSSSPTTTTTTPTTGTSVPAGESAPSIGVLRLSTERVYAAGATGCAGLDTAASVTVDIKGATDVTLGWKTRQGPRAVVMEWDGQEWSGEVGPFTEAANDEPTSVPITVTARGPGGFTQMADVLTVERCPKK